MRTLLSGTQHALRAGDYEAVIASVGATLRSLTFDGRDLTVPFDADEVRPSYRGATLAPWPNRVVDGRYTFAGVERQVALTEPARHHALHGLGSWLDYEAIDKGPSHVTLAAAIEPQTGYPWRILIETTFALDADGLTQTVTATNESPDTAPWGTGPHPYLVAGPGHVDDWTLELPAADVLAVTPDRLSPIGLRAVDADDPDRFDFRTARQIRTVELDHAYTSLTRDAEGFAVVRVTDAAGSGVEMAWGGACPWVQVHTSDKGVGKPGHRTGLAVEPMTCAPDAFNADAYDYDAGLIVLEPGASSAASWRISAIQ
ncbi:aldose 1-epimerase [Microbacterium sp. cf046]|uniref:aldose 1-epimerase family protein n=1 Tax=Microbacterium sp. cf046 TaxID=1761803 RepID=UPI0008F30F73|nr:aldose 1-epimerase family protein [Microbacterium sp. cf046]SFS14477.1 aldose 1-epimerase [Microbacterium sp. cf046]